MKGCTKHAVAGGRCHAHCQRVVRLRRGVFALKENAQEPPGDDDDVDDDDEEPHDDDDEDDDGEEEEARSAEAAPLVIKYYELWNCAAEHYFEDL